MQPANIFFSAFVFILSDVLLFFLFFFLFLCPCYVYSVIGVDSKTCDLHRSFSGASHCRSSGCSCGASGMCAEVLPVCFRIAFTEADIIVRLCIFHMINLSDCQNTKTEPVKFVPIPRVCSVQLKKLTFRCR